MNKIIFICLSILLFTLVFVQAQSDQISTSAQNQNDINTLNYALTLEHLESAFYNMGQATFNTSSFMSAGLPDSAYSYLGLIASHESAHVQLLTNAINSLGATPVSACTYNFSSAMSSVSAYIATARLLEETGVSAYDGAANTINNAGYLQTAATIATIEARHASYLNQLLSYIVIFNTTGQVYTNASSLTQNLSFPYSPFPNAFDTALSPTQILAAASGFIVNCPTQISLPVIAYTLTPYNFTNLNATVFNASSQYVTAAQFNNDNLVLNYSLTLELLGRAFYTQAAQYTANQFAAAGYSFAVWNNFQMIIRNELAHVAFLNSTLVNRGATPAQPCNNYNLGSATSSVANVLAFSRMLENLEVTAYDGAINRLTQYDLIQGAATIATVEARHGNYLNNVVNGTGVQAPNLDLTNDPVSILNITSPYFGAGCAAPAIPAYAYSLQVQYLAARAGSVSASPMYNSPGQSYYPYTGGASSLFKNSVLSWIL